MDTSILLVAVVVEIALFGGECSKFNGDMIVFIFSVAITNSSFDGTCISLFSIVFDVDVEEEDNDEEGESISGALLLFSALDSFCCWFVISLFFCCASTF
jgi:hypothetical protein